MEYSIRINDRECIVIINNKKIKNFRLRISINNEILITGNKITIEKANEIIFNHADWITKTMAHNQSSSAYFHLDEVKACKKIWLFGEIHDVIPTINKAENCLIEDCFSENKMLYIYVKSGAEVGSNNIKEVRQHFANDISEIFFEHLKIFTVCCGWNKEVKLYFKDMKSKYGYCLYKKDEIVLSTRLVHLPPRLIEYVIVHELCHFIYPNHSKLFYQEVGHYCPKYQELRKELRLYSSIFKTN